MSARSLAAKFFGRGIAVAMDGDLVPGNSACADATAFRNRATSSATSAKARLAAALPVFGNGKNNLTSYS
jgi:hypothetical protein